MFVDRVLGVRAAFLVLLTPLTALSASCLYSASDRCGPNMVYEAALAACACEATAISIEGGCQACAPDEVVDNNTCVCPAGQVKNDANLCAKVLGLGDACDTASAPCTDAKYNYCATGTGTAGTCTSTCATDTDCGSTYTCADWMPTPFCRTFSGVGKPCASNDDCSGLDAAECDTLQSHTCIVAGCTVTGNECPRGQMCCDYTQYGYGTLCAAGCQ